MMRRVSEIHCYLCGDMSGIWEWPATASPERGLFRPLGDGGEPTPGLLRSLRCRRCGGSVYLEGIEPVKRRPVLDAANLKPRRGRPPKYQSLAS
ncbi:MAG TPA: hypothetical protein VII06_30700 [Chloroflexota bacterium]